MTSQDDISIIIIIIIIIGFTGVLISAFSFYFVYTRLKLKKVIKGQLLGMTIHHLVSYLNISILLICEVVFGNPSKLLCIYGSVWSSSLYSGCQVFSSAISLSRFYMTWMTKSLKYPQNWIMIALTILAITFDLTLNTLALTLQAYFELPGLVATCNGYEPKESTFKTGWIIMTWICIVSVFGIAGDLGLKRYLKSRMINLNQVNNVQLVPWNNSKNAADMAKSTIPLRATLITCTTSITFFIALIIITILGNQDVVALFYFLYGCAQLPLIIGLTVKLNQKKIVPQQPQQQLNFHDEE